MVASHSSFGAYSLTAAELGLGGKVPFSAAKPTRLTALDECEVIEYVTVINVEARLMCSIGAAAWFTIFIVKSVEVTSHKENTLGALPIWPVDVESASTCIACFEDRGEPDPIMCEKVCPPHTLNDKKLTCSARKLTTSTALIHLWKSYPKMTGIVQIVN
jgi:hypothetical protein